MLLVFFAISSLLETSQAAVVWDGKIEGWRQEPTLFLGHGSNNRCHIGGRKNVLCKGSSQHLSQLQKVRLGVVRSARLLCSTNSHRSAPRFSTAGSSGSSLRTGLAMSGLLLMVALLAVVWRKRGSRGEAGAELQEQEEQGNLRQVQSCRSRRSR